MRGARIYVHKKSFYTLPPHPNPALPLCAVGRRENGRAARLSI